MIAESLHGLKWALLDIKLNIRHVFRGYLGVLQYIHMTLY